MKKKITLLAIFISISLVSLCQVNLDSLWGIWNDPNQPDTTRLKAMHKIAWDGYLFSQPDSAFYFAQLQYDLAKINGLKKQMSNAMNIQGASFYLKGNYASAIDYYTRSLTNREEIGDKMGIASCLNNIGIIYNYLDDYSRAIDYYTRSLAIQEEIGDKKGIASSLNNIGIIYKDQRDYTSALDYYTRSLTIREEIGYKMGIAISLTNIGIIYKEQGDWASAIDNHTRSLTIRKEIGDKRGIANSLNNIGIIYYNQGDYGSAITYSTRALIIAQEVGVAFETRDAADALFKAHKATSNNKLALEMYKLYITTRDSIDSDQNQKAVIRQEYKYEYEKQAIADSVAYIQIQKVQDAKLDKSRILQFALIGGLTLLLIFLAYVFNRYRVSRKQQLIISEQNKELASATEVAETANTELQTKSEELEKFNSTMLDREMRIIELKEEVNKLAKTNKTDLPYPEIGDE